MSRRAVALFAVLSLGLAAVISSAGGPLSDAAGAETPGVSASSLGDAAPTFVGPAATGCSTPGCSLLTGPFPTPSTASLSSGSAGAAVTPGTPDRGHLVPSPRPKHVGTDPTTPGVSCQPLGPGCDAISTSSGGAATALGLDAVDSASMPTNPLGDIEPSDQGLCAGNGYVVESNNVGEILVFNSALQRQSGVIPLDTLMGLTGREWSSGGDISCEFDHDHGGHWFFTEFVSANSEASGGPFTGCFAGAEHACYEGIAVSVGSSPFGPYNVYFLNANYNPREPGYPRLLNDFAKIGLTRDALLLFYDEFPGPGAPGLGFGFNGAQEFAIDKEALEEGLPVTEPDGSPNPAFNVAIENMGLLATPDGTCADRGACWYEVIPAQPPDPTQFDNSNGGSGFMLTSLDFFGNGDTRVAAFAWTDLSSLNSRSCATCGGIRFHGTLLSGVEFYRGEGFPQFAGKQKAGPIPLGDECGAAHLPEHPDNVRSCPEGVINTNGDGMTQVSQANGQLWGAVSTAVEQSFGASNEVHQGAAYWVVNTSSFDKTGTFGLTSQGYVSAAHEDLEFPAIAAEGSGQGGGNGSAVITFTLSGNGGPTGADSGGFYPSTAFGRLTTSSAGLTSSTINIAALGQSPADGFSEYLDFPDFVTSVPRWGDYSWAIFDPAAGKVYFATEYIPFASCTGDEFTLTIGTCGGTRDGLANWGTSVNSVTP